MTAMSLRLPPELAARVKAAAGRDRRSANAEVLHLIELGLDRQEHPWAHLPQRSVAGWAGHASQPSAAWSLSASGHAPAPEGASADPESLERELHDRIGAILAGPGYGTAVSSFSGSRIYGVPHSGPWTPQPRLVLDHLPGFRDRAIADPPDAP